MTTEMNEATQAVEQAPETTTPEAEATDQVQAEPEQAEAEPSESKPMTFAELLNLSEITVASLQELANSSVALIAEVVRLQEQTDDEALAAELTTLSGVFGSIEITGSRSAIELLQSMRKIEQILVAQEWAEIIESQNNNNGKEG